MLGSSNVTATVAVKDLNKAKEFYGQTLGLEQAKEDPAGVTYKSGSTELYVYPSQFAGTNQATYVVWSVSDVDGTVADLKSKGVAFEHYDNLPGATLQGDVHVMSMGGSEYKAAWFKDPDGNILSIGSM